MKIVAITSLPTVDRPNADRWKAARSHQKKRQMKIVATTSLPAVDRLNADRWNQNNLRSQKFRHCGGWMGWGWDYIVVELELLQYRKWWLLFISLYIRYDMEKRAKMMEYIHDMFLYYLIRNLFGHSLWYCKIFLVSTLNFCFVKKEIWCTSILKVKRK